MSDTAKPLSGKWWAERGVDCKVETDGTVQWKAYTLSDTDRATIRELRARTEKAEAEINRLTDELAELQEIFSTTQQQDTESTLRVGELLDENKRLMEALDNVVKEANRKQDRVDAIAHQGIKEVLIAAGVAGMREAVGIIRAAIAKTEGE